MYSMPSFIHDPSVVDADTQVLQRLPPANAAPLPAETRPVEPTENLSVLFGKRHIIHWKGMDCFTLRIAHLAGLLPCVPTANTDRLRHCCHVVNDWWHREGRFLLHFRLRTSNRLTFGMEFVYTSLPTDHPIHQQVLQRLGPEDPHPDSGSSPSASLLLRPTVHPPVTHDIPATHDSSDTLWRRFLHSFPVLSVYARVWNPAIAHDILALQPCAQSLVVQPADLPALWPSVNLVYPDVMASGLPAPAPAAGGKKRGNRLLSCMAQALDPRQPWEEWKHDGYPIQAVRMLHECVALVAGFQSHGPAVVEAVRLGQRASVAPIG